MRRLSKATTKPAQGQTLFVMAMAVFLLGLVLIAVTQMGDRARRQWYLQSVADNAAHSGAVLMARQLNLSAVLNRAMIGNQIAIAQWLGLTSWIMMMTQAIDNIALISSIIPPLRAIMEGIRQIIRMARQMVDNATRALLVFHNAVIKALSLAQVGLETVALIEVPRSIHRVIRAHDNRLEWSLFQGGSTMPFPSTWWRLTQLGSTYNREDSNKFKQLVLASRDPFTVKRTYQWVSLGIFDVDKAGGAELETPRNGRWNWLALDGVQFSFLTAGSFGLPEIVEVPLGWGARAQYRRYWATRGHPEFYGDAFRQAGTAADYAWNSMTLYRQRQLPFNFLWLRRNRHFGEHALVVKIVDTETQQVSYTRSEVRFTRPLEIFARVDSHYEKENLFNALWEGQLTPLSSVDKAMLLVQTQLTEGQADE